MGGRASPPARRRAATTRAARWPTPCSRGWDPGRRRAAACAVGSAGRRPGRGPRRRRGARRRRPSCPTPRGARGSAEVRAAGARAIAPVPRPGRRLPIGAPGWVRCDLRCDGSPRGCVARRLRSHASAPSRSRRRRDRPARGRGARRSARPLRPGIPPPGGAADGGAPRSARRRRPPRDERASSSKSRSPGAVWAPGSP